MSPETPTKTELKHSIADLERSNAALQERVAEHYGLVCNLTTALENKNRDYAALQANIALIESERGKVIDALQAENKALRELIESDTGYPDLHTTLIR